MTLARMAGGREEILTARQGPRGFPEALLFAEEPPRKMMGRMRGHIVGPSFVLLTRGWTLR